LPSSNSRTRQCCRRGGRGQDTLRAPIASPWLTSTTERSSSPPAPRDRSHPRNPSRQRRKQLRGRPSSIGRRRVDGPWTRIIFGREPECLRFARRIHGREGTQVLWLWLWLRAQSLTRAPHQFSGGHGVSARHASSALLFSMERTHTGAGPRYSGLAAVPWCSLLGCCAATLLLLLRLGSSV
jgi:hypothetical protein